MKTCLAEATMLFDRGLMDVYSTEDIAVLMTLIVQRLEMMDP